MPSLQISGRDITTLTGYQDDSSSTGHQGDMPHYEGRLGYELTKDIAYLTLMGELGSFVSI